MKKILALLICFVIGSPVCAQAQFFGFGRSVKPRVEEKVAAPEVKEEAVVKEEEPTEIRQIPVVLSQQEKEQADDSLRTDLKDTTKKDELKARIEYLEDNNYADKVELRRKLLRSGEDYKTSARIAQKNKGANVNPKNNAAMNDYIFKRAGLDEEGSD